MITSTFICRSVSISGFKQFGFPEANWDAASKRKKKKDIWDEDPFFGSGYWSGALGPDLWKIQNTIF